jgi:hypothetical protein
MQFLAISLQLTIQSESLAIQRCVPFTHTFCAHFSTLVQYFLSSHFASKTQHPIGLLGKNKSACAFFCHKRTEFFFTTKLCSPFASRLRALAIAAVNFVLQLGRELPIHTFQLRCNSRFGQTREDVVQDRRWQNGVVSWAPEYDTELRAYRQKSVFLGHFAKKRTPLLFWTLLFYI